MILDVEQDPLRRKIKEQRWHGIKILVNSGVKIIVQPGGSIRDQEVINAANKANIKMIFTGKRHFNH